MLKLNKEDLEQMYSKAKLAFKRCINDDENEFLENEINISIDSIVIKEESIKIEYVKSNTNNYVVETKIQLVSQLDKVIGVYIYYENENGIAIDDRLVFE